MKTINRECIPAGTTHICDDVFVKMNNKSKDSGWCKVWFEGKWHRNGYLSNCVKIEDLIKTETPEEKEALDLIDTAPQQAEKIYTQFEADAYAKKCVDHDRNQRE